MPEIRPELDQLFDALVGKEKHTMYEQIGLKLPHTFRFNPLKGDMAAQEALFREQGFRFEKLPGRDDIYQVTFQPYPIGKSLSHFMGHIYVQDIASMVPTFALDPQPGDWVLDMASAPGSKTTQIAAMMNNTGVIVANDVVVKRLKALGKNLERMSVINTLVYKWYGEQFGNAYFETFDRVLLDPACSGLGTLHKNPEVLSWWTPDHCLRLATTQRNLITSAIKALRPGGVLVYSTCTLTPVENEAVVQFALENFPVELEAVSIEGIPTWPGLTRFEDETFHPDMSRTLRLYPMDRVTEGFYIARLRKTGAMRGPRQERRKPPRHITYLNYKTSPVKKYLDFLQQHFEIPAAVLKRYNYMMKKDIVFSGRDIADFPVYGSPLQIGLSMARPLDRSCRLNTGGAHLLGHEAQRMRVDIPDLETLEKFANREPLEIAAELPGQYIACYKGNVIGYGIAESGRLKSQFPKGDWPFHLVDDWDAKAESAQPFEG